MFCPLIPPSFWFSGLCGGPKVDNNKILSTLSTVLSLFLSVANSSYFWIGAEIQEDELGGERGRQKLEGVCTGSLYWLALLTVARIAEPSGRGAGRAGASAGSRSAIKGGRQSQ